MIGYDRKKKEKKKMFDYNFTFFFICFLQLPCGFNYNHKKDHLRAQDSIYKAQLLEYMYSYLGRITTGQNT